MARKTSNVRGCMGRIVQSHSPDKHPEQDDPKVSAQDEAEYQAAMKGLRGPQSAPTPQPSAADDDVSKDIYKKPPPNKGGYFKLPWGGSK